jgi:hypothetical protein
MAIGSMGILPRYWNSQPKVGPDGPLGTTWERSSFLLAISQSPWVPGRPASCSANLRAAQIIPRLCARQP